MAVHTRLNTGSPVVSILGANDFEQRLESKGRKIRTKNLRLILDEEYELVIESEDGSDGCFDVKMKLK